MKSSRILVPVRGDELDKEAVELACKIAKGVKGKVYVLYIIEVKRSLPLDAELEPETRRAEEVLSRAEEAAEEQNYEVETDLLQAREAGPAIIDEAIERSVDLIVMGMSYHKRFGQFALGTTISKTFEQFPLGGVLSKRFGEFALSDTVSYVLQNAPCRVLLLHNLSTEGGK